MSQRQICILLTIFTIIVISIVFFHIIFQQGDLKFQNELLKEIAKTLLQLVLIGFIGVLAKYLFDQYMYKPQIEFNINCNLYGPDKDENYMAEFILTVNNKGNIRQKFKNIKLRIRCIEFNEIDGFQYWGYDGYRVNFPIPLTPNFSLTEKTFEALKKQGVPNNLCCKLKKLRDLRDRNYRTRDALRKALETEIGSCQEYIEIIMRSAETNSIEVIPEGYNFLFVEPGVKQDITYITKIPKRYKYIVAYASFYYKKYTPHITEKVFDISVMKPEKTK
jgi:hypothetical protein